MNIIPLPQKATEKEGSFFIDHTTAIVMDEALADKELETAKLLQAEISKAIALTLSIRKMPMNSPHLGENHILLRLDDRLETAEAYELTVAPRQILLVARDDRGLLYAAATLIQLCKMYHAEIGCMEICDAPSFAHRGYMMDVTRGRIPTIQNLKQMVDKLALYKINQLQLNMEACFQFEGLEEVWFQTDSLSHEDILELDRYCDIRGIELVPCLATFGHMYDLLRSESFRKYSEMGQEVGEPFTWYHRMRHHTINVFDPGSIALIIDLLDQYLPLFRSSQINICCDETFDLGKGKSTPMAEKMSYSEMYLLHVNRLVEHLEKKGKTVMMWADIVLNHCESMEKISKRVTYLNWYYYYGAEEEKVALFARKALKQYVCPSVSGYSRLVNNYDMSFTNIREMADLGIRYHAEGFLNTDWGDSGHVNMPALAVPCMIYGAAQSWNANDARDFAEVDQIISQVEFGDWSQKLVGLLRQLAQQDKIIFNDMAFFRDYKIYNLSYHDFDTVLYEKAKKTIMETSEAELKAAIARCREITGGLIKNGMALHDSRQNEIAEFLLAARGVALMQELALMIKRCEYGQDVALLATPEELARRLELWFVDYCKAWRKASRESELYRIREFILHICIIIRKYDAS
jgi:hypothetical protein